MPTLTPEKQKTDNDRIYMAANSIKLDASGQVPTRIQIMETGEWPDSVKGDFTIALGDLQAIKQNFDAGIGFPTEDASTGLAIDFMHNYDEQAAAWVKGLEVVVDPNDATRGALYANPIEWTDAGAKAVMAGDFKCISPSGYFGSRNGKVSMWSNPRDLKETVPNVLDGAGLTNIPFLRGMKPIRADKNSDIVDKDDSAYGKLIYVVSDQHKKEQTMPELTLDSLRGKERNELSVPELDFLAENKSELSAVERQKFQLEEAETNEEQLSDEDKNLLAAIKSGDKAVVDKTEQTAEQAKISSLEKTALDYRTEKANAVVAEHINRGAIKQDAADFWTKQLLSTDGDERKALEDQLAAIPSNEKLAEELGTSEDTVAGSTAREQLHNMANVEIAKAAKEGKTLLYADALKQVTNTNPDLAKQDGKEQLAGVK